MNKATIDIFKRKKPCLAISWLVVLSAFYLFVFKLDVPVLILAVALPVLLLDFVWLNKMLNQIHLNLGYLSNSVYYVKDQQTDGVIPWLKNKIALPQLLIVYFAFFARSVHSTKVRSNNHFSYVKQSHANDIFWVVATMQLPTLPFIHYLLEQEANSAVAWLVSFLTIWSVVYYRAQVKAIERLPIVICGNTIKYRYGLAWQADIPIEQIKSIRLKHPLEKIDGQNCFSSPIGSNKNIVLECYEPVVFCGFCFYKTSKSKIVVSLDEPDRFINAINQATSEVWTGTEKDLANTKEDLQ